jgi:glycosyltransferase involved in cell wall biosynthesis
MACALITQGFENKGIPIKNSSKILPKHLAIFIPSLAGGGVARVMLHLAEAFVGQGHKVDLVMCQLKGPYANRIPPGINVIELKPTNFGLSRIKAFLANPEAIRSLCLPILLALKPPKTIPYLHSLTVYLRREQPDAMLSAKTPSNLVAIWAKRLATVGTRIVVSERTNLSMMIQQSTKWRWRFVLPLIRKFYPQADLVLAVSNGVANDFSSCTGLSREGIRTIYNPTLTNHIKAQSILPVSHSWFDKKNIPVILGVGRLAPSKDFPTLLKAFAHIHRKHPARLLILGEGRERAKLEALASELGIVENVSFPGFESNPYAFMSRASVFVLSSAWEGLPNALIEALACGCPVVSTNCPSGPQEILSNGAFGPLVPVGDDRALAGAILQTLEHPPSPERLRARAAEFDIHTITEQYLQALLPK